MGYYKGDNIGDYMGDYKGDNIGDYMGYYKGDNIGDYMGSIRDDQNNPVDNVPTYDDTVVATDDTRDDDDDDEPSGPMVPSTNNSINTSFDVSFAESTADEDAQLISFSSLSHQQNDKSISGRVNKVYETLNPLNRGRRSKRNSGSAGPALNRSLDSEGDSLSNKSSSTGSDAYEPMQVRPRESDVSKTVSPAMSINPLFDEQVQTKL
ncbi:hypothetical protein Btru_040339 [Bulinus truncatus]|nr:hypothetical protein Btru_040339 [Bulinus truncatus]